MLYLDIIYNLSLLVALSVLSGFIGQKRQLSESTRSLLQGNHFISSIFLVARAPSYSR
jgi:hypothetical protein